MNIGSAMRTTSFKLLSGETSGDEQSLPSPTLSLDSGGPSPRQKRKNKASKKKKKEKEESENKRIAESPASEDLSVSFRWGDRNLSPSDGVRQDPVVDFAVSASRTVVESVCESKVFEPERGSSQVSCVSYVELRQRNVGGSVSDEPGEEASSQKDISKTGLWKPDSNGFVPELKKEESFDWDRVIAGNPTLLCEISSPKLSPFKYFVGEIYGGSSLRSTVHAGNEKKRQRVYNSMFHVPWRCERLIVAGFFVCLDSFLSLLTIMPARIFMAVWRLLRIREFWRPTSAELSDFGCFIILALGVAALKLADISMIYHFIRGQGTIKLYVVYNVLEIFDKLCQSFGEDVLQVLFDSAEGLSNCPPEDLKFGLLTFIFDETIAVAAFIVHSFILLAQAITLSTCIIAHNNALMALLVSSNFAEIKSNVFKRFSKENLHNLVYFVDIIERFHITAFILFILAQNILEADGPWFDSFLTNVLQVYICEVFVDAVKHSFLAKFNEIKPEAYSDFLEDLCKQTLKEKPDEKRKDLPFIPLAPACVVIRVLEPVYSTMLPIGPLPWRLLGIFIWFGLTYIIFAFCKILVGQSLRHLATWYINHRQQRKQHVD